ncbi:molybdate ABC transporter substrate-binding protein [Rhodovulum sp. P5]|uniref:molybdate ABC transporter substrate-binding protein n=1 Tax=Rhodovulum sp. P5 TaxID=1564506 RepID=UPI0009DAEFAA|nr:molybdate ABC transporter substrate-binding protein [Rhodovulum sp. P5]
MTRFPYFRPSLAVLALSVGLAGPVRADDTIIAVAANFTAAAKEIGTAFETATGHHVTYSFGSTGQLYTQITQGAPFEAFLAADTARPEKAEAAGLGVPGTRFTYATGKIVLWSADPDLINADGDILHSDALTHVAIANPVTAPYGAAAVEAMQALGVYEALQRRIVQGKTILQTYQFAATGNADVGFVALSQVAMDDAGSRWGVPDDLYAPIRQDAILLQKGADSAAAAAYLDFLKSPEAARIIERFGYGTGG